MNNINYNANKKAIDEFRKELMAMVEDIREIDIRVLNRAVSDGIKLCEEQLPSHYWVVSQELEIGSSGEVKRRRSN